MATLEKPKQKKNKHAVPSKSSRTKSINETENNINVNKELNDNGETAPQSSCSKELLTENVKKDNDFIIQKDPTNQSPEDDKQKENVSSTEEDICDIESDVIISDNNVISPTAPLLEIPAQQIIAYPQLPVCENTEQVQVQPEKVKKEVMKPFTESQLKALYTNQELTASKQFVAHFVDSELHGVNAKQHPLYELLMNYLHAKDKLKENTLELDQLKIDYKASQNQLWLIETATASNKAQCQDGTYVTASHKYKVAKFQRPLLENLMKTQNKIKKLTNEIHTLHSYKTTVLKIKIDHYIETVLSSCRNIANLSPNSPVTLLQEPLSTQVQFPLKELRVCISVLFSFQRQLYKDKDFVIETRNWLTDMVAVLLRLSDWQDHMYILNQVLRCPAGIGSWASSYIQVPSPCHSSDPPFSNRHLNHVVAVLNILLRTIEKRNVFLEQMLTTLQEPHDPVAENLWVLVDSDGEDDDNTGNVFALKENDLVALLNQIPIDDLFRSIMFVQKQDNTDFFDKALVTEHHAMRFFAFCTVLVSLLNEGLITYNIPRYHQFAKRLCRLIRHTLQYASDMWEIIMSSNNVQDAAMLKRLQTEYDAFFWRAGLYLYQAKDLGAWQFLAVAPFHTISIQTLWKFFFILQHGGFQNYELEELTDDLDIKSKLSEQSSRQIFCERLSIMSTEESYYLFNTFANMIMARPVEDQEFIQFATINLLQISFCGSDIQESCSKCAAILLSNITGRYPNLMSNILSIIKNSITDLSMPDLEQIIFLFSELPLHNWYPTDDDMAIFETWLMQHPVNSIESYLARKIISDLNWDVTTNGTLILPWSLHRNTAVLVAQVIDKHISGASATLLEGMKQAVGQQATPEQNLLKWAWQMVFRLRLHVIDRGTVDVRDIPEVVEIASIQKGMREHQPLACYLALAVTSVGHLPPLVCSQGLTQLELLLASYKYDAAIIALHNIVPLFVDSIDTLLMCTSFKNIMVALLAADKTYMKMAKSLISTEFPGTILRQFGNMIESHTHNPKWQNLMVFWVQALISVPNWNKDAGVLYLLNIIIKTAFFIPEIFKALCDVFIQLLEKSTDRNNSGSSILSWMSLGSNLQGSGSSLVLGPGVSVSKEPWLGFLVTAIEHHRFEIKTGLWPELLRQLYNSTGKTNVDNSLKKAANMVKVPSFSSAGLCLYRWAQQALDTPLDHPLLPLLWQNFFSLYLTRIPSGPNRESKGSVGSKFFDGMVNTSFCKKLKKRLQESVDFYKSKLEPPASQNSEGLDDNSTLPANKDFFQRCHVLFKAFVLWLEEPLLQEATLYLPSLPPQYEPRYLSVILQNSKAPWLELINFEVIHSEYEKAKSEWNTLCHRHKRSRPVPLKQMGVSDITDPVERVIRRLASYDKPQPAPELKPAKLVIPTLNFTNRDSVAGVLQPYVKKLQQFAEIYTLQVSEHGALDCQYNDLVQQLYSNFQTKIAVKKTCKSTCSGSAIISITFCEGRVNESIKHQMQINRTNFATLLTRSLQPPTLSVCMTCASIEETISVLHARLQECLRLADSTSDEHVRAIGVEFFYYLFAVYNEELKAYPPTHQLFNTCMEKLGRIFICGIERETTRLCRTILQQPNKSSLLSPHFSAVNVSTTTFLQMYSDVCDKIDQIPDVAFALMSKIEITSWLTNKRPRLTDRSKFIQLIFQSLIKLGSNPAKQNYALHEAFRRHLLCIFRYEFPEHYGEILMLTLQNSGAQNLAMSVWMDILNALSFPSQIQLDVQLKEQLRQHATHQKMLQQKELIDTTSLLAQYFSQERLQFGLYGLYPKYRFYIDPLCLMLGMTTHAVVVATLNMYSNLLADQLCDHLWPHIAEMFSPWLVPYWMKQYKDSTATWIQQLADDRSVLLPWIQADITNAQKLFNMFANCILFIGDTLPACNNLLSYVWQYYVSNFAHPTIKEHVWVVVHKSLMTIVWERFWPSLADLESMLKVMDQYIPECHVFLGHVFLEVNWTNWLARLTQANNAEASIRAHRCLLHLFIKLSNEPNIRQNDKSRVLLERAREYSWHILDIVSLEQVLDWYVMSCDPRVALTPDAGLKLIDYNVLGLLRVASCYDSINQTIDISTLRKRQCFIRAYVKLLANCSNRHKSLVNSKSQQFQISLRNQLDHMENMINTASTDPTAESDLLVAELLGILNNAALSPVALDCFEQWLSTRTAESYMLQSFLRIMGITVASSEAIGTLFECALNSYFNLCVTEGTNPTWERAIELINLGPPKQPPLEQSLVLNGRLLTLRAVILKHSACDDNNIHTLLETVVDWLTHIKVTDINEPKLPLLWNEVIKLSLRVCHRGNEAKAGISLRKFVHNHLLPVAECKSTAGGWGRGLLGAIGLAKQNTISPRGRFLCKALAGYILAQLPEPKGEPQTVRCFAGASGPVGQPGGNVECAKILLKLDAGVSELKPTVEQALRQIQDPQNSLHNGETFLFSLVDVLYSNPYLKRQ